MRRFVAIVLWCLVFAPVAQGKLSPSFSKRVTEPGNIVEIDVGKGSELFLGPLRIYLVRLDVAGRVRSEVDGRLVKIGELGRPEKFGTPPVLRFEVPDLPAGEYTAAIWFKGYASGRWHNALESIHPLLTIRAADGSDAPRRWAASVAACVLGLGLFIWRHRRRWRAHGAGHAAAR